MPHHPLNSLNIGLVSVTYLLMASSATPAWSRVVFIAGQTEASNPAQIWPCYMQTAQGAVINLTDLCGFVSPTVCSQTVTDTDKQAVLSQFCQQQQKCLLNNTCNTIPPIQQPKTDSPVGEGRLRLIRSWLS